MTTTEKHFIFTMTPGRSGTAYLADLLAANLPDSECHHEIIGWDQFGLNTPDLSHMTLFNSQGNIAKVREFWQQKLARIAATSRQFYVETSHVLMKAGLIENLALLTQIGRVHLIDLRRDPLTTIKSYRARFDFMNIGNMWQWYLDPDYPRNLSNSRELVKLGVNGICLWYLTEIRLRAAYYEKLLVGDPRARVLHFNLEEISQPAGAARLLRALTGRKHAGDVVVPAAQNVAPRRFVWEPGEEALLKKLITSANFDASALADVAIKQGLGFNPELSEGVAGEPRRRVT